MTIQSIGCFFSHQHEQQPDFKQWFINTRLATVKRETSLKKKEKHFKSL